MQHVISEPLADGQTIAFRATHALVTLQCVRVGNAYTVTTSHAGIGGPRVNELSSTHATEAAARVAARWIAKLFHTGATVRQALDQLAAPTAAPVAVRPVAAPITLLPRQRLVRRPGAAGSIRPTPAQYTILAACLAAGTDQIGRGDGEASIATLRPMARLGMVDLLTDDTGDEVLGARVTGYGWRALSWETARRTGKPAPDLVPVPTTALARTGALHLAAAA